MEKSSKRVTHPNKNKKKIRLIKKFLLTEIRNVFIIIGIIFFVKVFIIDFGVVDGHSMEPNLKDGQLIVLKKWDIHFGGNTKGIHFYDKVTLDNVKFEGIKQPVNIAKRVIGLPGDYIQIISGDLYRNGKKIVEPLIKEKMVQPNQTFNVGKDEVFVMGDNRNNSTDSREIGPIPIQKVSGVIIGNYDAKWFFVFNQKIKSLISAF